MLSLLRNSCSKIKVLVLDLRWMWAMFVIFEAMYSLLTSFVYGRSKNKIHVNLFCQSYYKCIKISHFSCTVDFINLSILSLHILQTHPFIKIKKWSNFICVIITHLTHSFINFTKFSLEYLLCIISNATNYQASIFLQSRFTIHIDTSIFQQ